MDSSLWIKSCCRNFLMNASALSLMSWDGLLSAAFFAAAGASFPFSLQKSPASSSLPCSAVVWSSINGGGVEVELFFILASSLNSLNQQIQGLHAFLCRSFSSIYRSGIIIIIMEGLNIYHYQVPIVNIFNLVDFENKVSKK
jgi:hypothetical protein